MEIEVTQADRDAANLAFNVWDNTNELALAFARHRQAAIKKRDAQIVAWLRDRKEMTDRYIDYVETAQAADCIEAEEV